MRNIIGWSVVAFLSLCLASVGGVLAHDLAGQGHPNSRSQGKRAKAPQAVRFQPMRIEARPAGAVGPSDAMPPAAVDNLVVATYETEYGTEGRKRGRAHNVELAASKLNGATIAPGAILSFNERVGARTRRAGFRRAKVIQNGELVDGMGGGVCQVASTLHAAALYAGLDTPEHRPHSRPSSYIPMSMDATVAWPRVDLKIHNPFEFPLTVHAIAEAGVLRVDLLGRERPLEVEVTQTILSRSQWSQRIVEDPTLAPGTRRVSQRGKLGARVERVRTIREGDQVFTETRIVMYPPTYRIVRVGVGVAVPTAVPAATPAATPEATPHGGPVGALAMR